MSKFKQYISTRSATGYFSSSPFDCLTSSLPESTALMSFFFGFVVSKVSSGVFNFDTTITTRDSSSTKTDAIATNQQISLNLISLLIVMYCKIKFYLFFLFLFKCLKQISKI